MMSHQISVIKRGLGSLSRHGKKQLRNYENMNSLKLTKMPLLKQKWLKKLKNVELHVLERQISTARRQEEEEKAKNRIVLKKLFKCVYFLVNTR